MADVTVVTPTVPERGQMLAEAIACVQAQTVQPAAHLISVDYSYEGPAVHLNRMIGACETEWFSVLPDDDLWLPNHLEAHTGAFEDDVDLVFSLFRHEGEHAEQRNAQMYRGKFDPNRLLVKKDSGLRAVFTARKSLWETAGGYPADTMIDDWEFMVACVMSCCTVVRVPVETWVYRFHGGNVSDVIAAIERGEEHPNPMFVSKLTAPQGV